MWRINGYWFFEESDGSVFITCDSITDAEGDCESAQTDRSLTVAARLRSRGGLVQASACEISAGPGSSMVNCLRE